MDTYIYKSTKIGDVGNDPVKFHSWNKVTYFFNILIEFEHFDLTSWVTTGFIKFFHDIIECGHSNSISDILFQFYTVTFLFIADKLCDGTTTVFSHILYDIITLRMYSTVIERVFRIWYS